MAAMEDERGFIFCMFCLVCARVVGSGMKQFLENGGI